MNKAEYPMLGVVLCEYRDAVQLIDGCLSTAIDISKQIDIDDAADLVALRLALLQACEVADGILARRSGPRKDS